jgi:hypothetical protein
MPGPLETIEDIVNALKGKRKEKKKKKRKPGKKLKGFIRKRTKTIDKLIEGL